ALDRGRCRFQPGQTDAHEYYSEETDGGINRLLDPFLLGIGRACNIHGCFVCLDGKFCENDRAFVGANDAPLTALRVSHDNAMTYVDAKDHQMGAKVSGYGTVWSQDR